MIQGLLLGTLGLAVVRANLLAILYLWLLVPSGQFALPLLQSIAAYGTEWQLQLAGIPNFREGFLIQTPTGLYRIAPGCAGLNFVLTAIAVTPLYGYLFYQGLKKRVIAVAAMIVVALVANAFRIFAIIALAEATDRQIDIVDDHIVYGWGFFSLVLLLMGMVGMKWADTTENSEFRDTHKKGPAKTALQLGTLLLVVGFSVLIVIGATVAASVAKGRWVEDGQAIVKLPDTIGSWQSVDTEIDWQPTFVGAHGHYYRRYEAEACCVDLFIAYYWRQSDDRELITDSNKLANSEDWIVESESGTSLQVGNTSLPVVEAQLMSTESPPTCLVLVLGRRTFHIKRNYSETIASQGDALVGRQAIRCHCSFLRGRCTSECFIRNGKSIDGRVDEPRTGFELQPVGLSCLPSNPTPGN